MRELFGFFILTAPLFLIISWILICIVLGIFTSRKLLKNRTVPTKTLAGVLVFLLGLVIPVADEIAGRIYYTNLCEEEAGVKVYKTILLSADNWDENGRPIFYDDKNGNLNLPINTVEWQSKEEEFALNVVKTTSLMKEKVSGKTLNERILFIYSGGWVSRNFTPQNTAYSCGGDLISYNNYINQIFQPSR